MLYAFNKTGAPVVLAAGKPVPPTIPASEAPPLPGEPFDATGELWPAPSVDAARGKAGGLEAADFAALEAQRLTGDITYQWDGQPDYETGALIVSGPAPGAHAATHENGGADEINIAGLSGQAADPQIPDTHATAHENGGADEIDVTDLSGLLADPQTPATHAASHELGGADEIAIAQSQVIGLVTTADLELWIDGTAGNDANDGSSLLNAVQTPQRLDELLPQHIYHNVIIHASGKQSAVPWDFNFHRVLHNGVTLLIAGDGTLSELVAERTADGSSVNWIEDSTLALTPNEYQGAQILFTGGALAGEKYTIGQHTATRFYPAAAESGGVKGTFSADPGLVTFKIVRPSTEIETVCTPGDFDQQVSATYSVDGEGWLLIEGIHFSGNMPLNFTGGTGGKTRTYLSDCTLLKPQGVGFNFWNWAFFGQKGLFGFRNVSQDPTVFGHTTPIAGNHAGFGEMGGDASIIFYSGIVEFSAGYFYASGSALQYVVFQAGSGLGPNINSGSYVGFLQLLDSVVQGFVPVEQAFLGNFIPFGWAFPIYPPVYQFRTTLAIKDCDVSGGLATGIANLDSVTWLQGTITGTNGAFGALTKGGRIYRDPTAVVTLSGPLGDFSFDGATPAGTWGGADVTDPNELSRYRTLAFFFI